MSYGMNDLHVCVQGRPFREGIRENSVLWWGLVGASTVAFSGATDFMPEINRWLQIVEMNASVCVYVCMFRYQADFCSLKHN
jgi:manganese-transporting P-type ATPase